MTDRRVSGCSEENLVLYHYRDLDGAAVREVENHLEHCAACRDSLREIRETLAAVPRPTLEMSGIEAQRFAGRVIARTESRSRRRTLSLWGGSLATAAVVLLTFFSLRPGPVPNVPRAQVKMSAQLETLPDLDLLQNLDLLENMDLLQELDVQGGTG
jgi:anti-sigma factor RsiW